MTPEKILRWSYSRNPDNTSTGSVSLGPEHWSFAELTFKEMLAHVSRVLLKTAAEAILIVRPTSRKTHEFLLEAQIVEALRTDLEKAENMMTWTPTAKNESKPEVLGHPSIRAGLSTLAESFSDEVFILSTVDRLECPFCSLWVPAFEKFHCTNCGQEIELVHRVHEERWYLAKVQDLLASNAPKFFLPRRWNKGKTWISKEELQELSNQWKKMKES